MPLGKYNVGAFVDALVFLIAVNIWRPCLHVEGDLAVWYHSKSLKNAWALSAFTRKVNLDDSAPKYTYNNFRGIIIIAAYARPDWQ